MAACRDCTLPLLQNWKAEMRLLPDWKQILKKAWSVRFLVLAGVFSTAEVVLPLFVQDMPRGIFVALTSISILGSLFSRVIVQKGLRNDE
jgi:hypothetical protein